MNNLYNAQIERDIISLAVNYPEIQAEIFDLPNDYFYSDSNRSVFNRLKNGWLKNKPIDTKTIFQILPTDEALQFSDYVGRTQYVPYLNQLIELNNKRRIAKFADNLDMNKTSDELMMEWEMLNNSIDGAETGKLIHIDDLINKYGNEKEYKEMTTSVLKTGFIDVDKKMIVKKGDLVIIAGRPSSGKTAYALSIAQNQAKAGNPVAFFSLEMRGQYLLRRLAQSSGHKYPGYEGFKEGLKHLKGIPFYIDDVSNYNIRKLEAQIKTAVKKLKCKSVFIDYLTLLDPPEAQNMHLAIQYMSRRIKIIAEEMDIPIILLSQLNRKVDDRKDKEPMLSDLRESGAIEQDADLIQFTFIPWNYGITEDKKTGDSLEKYMRIIQAKGRDCGTAKFNLYYNRDSQYMANWGKTENYINSLPDQLPETDNEDLPL